MTALEEQLDRDPHDETAFLVYADALLERGNPHGELIRVQYALSRKPGDTELEARERHLRKQLMPGLAASLGTTEWRLGFPRSLSLMWVGDENFGELAAMLRSRLCRFIEKVTLADYATGERVVDLLELLPHLEEVCIANNLEVLGSQSTLMLTREVGRLKGLRRLRLHTHSATVLLTEVPAFPNLQRLTLSGTRLVTEDVPVLEQLRAHSGRGCELRLTGGTCSFAIEQRLVSVWPLTTDDLKAPGLLLEAPLEHRGCWLLASDSAQRIGQHLACELSLPASGMRAVHSVFQGNTLRDAGDLSTPPRVLADGELMHLGNAALRYCEDVHAAREALKASG